MVNFFDIVKANFVDTFIIINFLQNKHRIYITVGNVYSYWLFAILVLQNIYCSLTLVILLSMSNCNKTQILMYRFYYLTCNVVIWV